MQVLYVVEFDVHPKHEGVDPYSAVVDDITKWLSYTAGRPVPKSELEATGSVSVPPNPRSGDERTSSWEVVQAAEAKAIRLEVREVDANSEAVFLTRVTLGQIDSRTTVRVSMARESSPTWLSPAPPANLHQPSIIRSLAGSRDVTLFVRGQAQDGRYIQVRLDNEVDELVAIIKGATRLPILLMHTRTMPALDLARTVGRKLVGLVRVVTLDYRTLCAVEERMPGFAPPVAGARLIWSDPTAETVVFDGFDVNDDNPEFMRARLMRLLSPLSVLARGVDTAYREVRRAELRERDLRTREQSRLALERGDASVQVKALQEELNAVRENADDWQHLAEEEEQRADRFQAIAEQVPELEDKIAQLSLALRSSSGTSTELSKPDPWDDLPTLETGSETSASSLYLRLTDAASGRIVFTDRAVSSWKKCRYPYPEEMTECLVKLARVAAALYDGTDRTIDHLDNWIRDEFHLKVALQDSVIEQNPRLWKAYFEGEEYDRTPHVKVRDHAPPSEVGRIHFALDSKNRRLVVDHVALKLS